MRAGPPPRVWGELCLYRIGGRYRRSTPTRVGRTYLPELWQTLFPVHPHACGENANTVPSVVVLAGPPPRVWGERDLRHVWAHVPRSTPTRVGRTPLSLARQSSPRSTPTRVGRTPLVVNFGQC